MIDMGFLSISRRSLPGRRMHGILPRGGIARRTGLSRNTVKKYLREDAVEPNFKTPSRSVKLDPYGDRFLEWLLAQPHKSRKKRRHAKLPVVTLPAEMHCQPMDI